MLARVFFVCLILCLATAAQAQERHALVVGIDAYDNLGSLEKAVNDGRAMAASLERAGFTVDAGYDLDRRGFVQLLAQFLNRLQPEDEALVFYAGHAVAIGNANYLVPSDASALAQSSEALIIAESIGQDFLLDQITGTGVRLTVTPSSFVFELAETPEQIDAFAELMRPLGLVELARTGVAAMSRGGEGMI